MAEVTRQAEVEQLGLILPVNMMFDGLISR